MTKEQRAYMKTHLNSLYGKMVTDFSMREAIKEAFESGNTHAVYIDTDSCVIDGRDKTFCVYDYARELLK